MKSPVVLDFFRELKRTSGRFISITLLILLAVGFYSGLRATQPDMLAAADNYMDSRELSHVRVQSTLGLTDDDTAAICETGGVLSAEGGYSIDTAVRAPDTDIIVTLKTLSQNGMNSPELLEGRLPQTKDECVAERPFLTRMELPLGGTFVIEDVTEGLEDALIPRELTVVGVVRTPAYISRVERGISALGNGRVAAYAMILPEAVELDYYTEINITVAGAAAERAYTDAYDDVVTPVLERLEELAPLRETARREGIVRDAEKELNDARAELEDGRVKLEDARAELEDAQIKYADGLAELEDARTELNDARVKYQDGVNELAEARITADRELADALEQLNDAKQQLEDGRTALHEGALELEKQKADGEKELDDALLKLYEGKAELEDGWKQYYSALEEFTEQEKQWEAQPDYIKAMMPGASAELEAARIELESAERELKKNQESLDKGFDEYNTARKLFGEEILIALASLAEESKKLEDAEAELESGFAEYETEKADALREIENGEAELRDAREKIADGEEKLRDGETELIDAQQKITDGEAELNDAELELADAEEKLRDAQQEIDDIPECEWYVTGRESNPGYTGYRQDAERMGALAAVFPTIFFAVAVLVCLTAMTRMVDERRVEIGTFKALGLSGFVTSGKFIFYALLAAITGIIVGLSLGMTLIPRLIFHAYSILYELPPIKTPVQPDTVLISAAAAILCTVGATALACAAALRETPSSLLRPRAPTPGKRVFLEYIKPLWRHMSFFAKVSARNVLRYKKRLFMTIAGIAGCTALVVTGLGLRDSILDLPDRQFSGIYKYDLLITVTEEASKSQLESLYAELEQNSGVSGYAPVRSITADFINGGAVYSGDIIVPEKPEELDGFIKLSTLDGEAISLSGGAVITAKLAELLKLKPGGEMTLTAGDSRYTVTVAAVTEHYVQHYVYLPPEYYESVFGEAYETNRLLVRCTDTSTETASTVSSALLRQKAAGYAAHFRSAADAFEKSIGSINSVIVIIILSAAALAFIVLFNLSSINITERRRELATIKVLGFYDGEVTWYIFRENTFLTLFGIAFGLVGGKYLHRWLITTVEVDFTRFLRTVEPRSYVIAALLTAVFAVIVNIAGHISMKRISMTESLKINE